MIKNLDQSLFIETQGKYKVALNLKQELKTDKEKDFFEGLKKSVQKSFEEIQMREEVYFSEKAFCESVFFANFVHSNLLGIEPIKFTITIYRADGSSIEIKEEDVL